MERKLTILKFLGFLGITLTLSLLGIANEASARDAVYGDGETVIAVNPGEPTQIEFPANIQQGYKRSPSALTIDRKASNIVVFAKDSLPSNGEVLIVRLDDGRSYSIRIRPAGADMARDDIVKIQDDRPPLGPSSEEEEPKYKEKHFEYAPPTQVSGLMREMILNAEFGKATIQGYRGSDRYKGQTVINDGTMRATIENIYIGPDLWGYVLNLENLLDQTQKVNPATFRIDGTRAISVKDWELSPRPSNIEQKISNAHQSKVYIVAKAR